MGTIKIELPEETFKVEIAGDTPTVKEKFAIEELIRSKQSGFSSDFWGMLEKKKNKEDALHSIGITSSVATQEVNGEKNDNDFLTEDFLNAANQSNSIERIEKELEKRNRESLEKDSIITETSVSSLNAQKNQIQKKINEHANSNEKGFFGEYIYSSLLGGFLDAGQQGIQAGTELAEVATEKAMYLYDRDLLERKGHYHFGLSMPRNEWDALPEESKNRYYEVYKVFEDESYGNNIYFGKDLTFEAPYELPKIDEPQTMLGGFVRDISQFLSAFVFSPGGKLKVGRYVVKGGIADALFDPEEGNLSTMIKELVYTDENGVEQKGIAKEVLDLLDSKVDESAEAEDRLRARLKQTFEGGVLGLAVDGLIVGLKAAKNNESLMETIKKGITEKVIDTEKIVAATKVVRSGKAKLAAETALKHRKLKTDIIKQFEQTIGARSELDIDEIIKPELLISKKDKKGFLVLDMDKAKTSGKNIAELRGISETLETEVSGEKGALNILDTSVKGLVTGERGKETASLIRDAENKLVFPILKPEKLDALVSAAGEIFAKYPDKVDLKNKKVIDNLMDLSLKKGKDGKPLLATDELLSTLNKYGISYEEYVTMAVGSASQAGKVLQKFSLIARRFKSGDAKASAEGVSKTQSNIWKGALRIENISRGLLVSQVATAMRNLQSAYIRAPLEGLGNVMDTALYNLEKGGIAAGGKALLSPANWADSFKGMRYMFDASNWDEFKGMTDFILKSPGLEDEYLVMFNQVNEIRRNHQLDFKDGNSFVKMMDTTLSGAEQGVDFLNTLNRWQEFMVRRTVFMGELERLTKRNYNIDLIEYAQTGNIDDLLAREDFKDVITEAVGKAMDVTYAKQPDFKFFKDTTNFITRNGLTTVAPFPRFMFNSMELLGNYTAGGVLPLTKKAIGRFSELAGKEGYQLTAKDRKQLSRNILGLNVILPAAIMYRNQDNAPADYKYMEADDGNMVDTTTLSPLLRQTLFIAEANKRWKNGELQIWINKQGYKEASETIFGTNIRAGGGEVIFREFFEALDAADGMSHENATKSFGNFVGEWLSRFLTPLNQIIDVQREFDFRTDEFKELRVEPKLKQPPETRKEWMKQTAMAFGQYTLEPLKKRGYLNIFNPKTDQEFIDQDGVLVKVPSKQGLFQAGDKQYRVSLLLKVLTGLSVKKESSEAGKFLEDLGYKDYRLVTRNISPGFQNFQAQWLRSKLPTLVQQMKELAKGEWKENAENRSDQQREKKSDKTYIRDQQRAFFDKQMLNFKNRMDSYIGYIENDGDVNIDIEMTRYARANVAWRRLRPVQRIQVLNNPHLVDKEKWDFSNVEDLELMAKLGKRF